MSQRQLVDCDTIDFARNGGLVDNGFDFADKNALCTEASFSFNAMKSACEASSHTIGFVQKSVTRHKDAYTNSEKVFMSTVAQQPVSILEAQTRTPIREPCETARCPNEEKGRA